MFESTMFWILGLLSVAVALIVNFYNQKFKYWSDRGVNGPKPRIIFGNILDKLFGSRAEMDVEYEKKYGKLFGYYNGPIPSLFIMESELIKNVMVKDFHCFMERPNFRVIHEMMKNNLLFSQNEKWKRMRTITSPSFTSGKLRAMIPLMEKCVDQFVRFLDKKVQNNGGVINVKEVTTGFTIDVIASTSFATDTNANEEGEDSVLVKQGKKFFDVSFFRGFATFVFPVPILKLLNIKTFNDPESFEFFINLTKEIVKKRKNENFKRNDLVQLMMDAYVDENELNRVNFDQLTASLDEDSNTEASQTDNNSTSRKTLTELEIIANSVLFFFAGFDTTASTLSFCLYELAKNPDIQERLHQEVKKAIEQNPSMDRYDLIINNIPYLEAVVKETLRKNPPLTEILRSSTVDKYQIKNFTIDKGTLVVIPVYAIHHNPDYYPDPERFNPDRFLPENKHLLVPYTYLSFGQGPRNCVGMRFAYQELKMCLSKLILQYKLNVTPKTPNKLKFAPITPLLKTKDIEIQLSKR